MSYFLEVGLSHGDGFYAEFLIVDNNTGFLIPRGQVDHQFQILGEHDDYGDWRCFGQTIASNANGLITEPKPGVTAVAIPGRLLRSGCDGGYFGAYGACRDRDDVRRFRLLAVPPDADFTAVLITGTLSFGDRLMSCARYRVGTFPLYPNSIATLGNVSAGVTQVKRQLVKLGAYDQVEAALQGPVDPATISWNTGGSASIGGPLMNVISATIFNNDPVATGLFLTVAASIAT